MPASEEVESADGEAEELEALLHQAEAPRASGALDALPLDALGPARVQAARDAYESLQRAALRAVADLAALQQRLAARLQEAAAQREAAQHGFTDAVQLIDKYREERDRAAREAGLAADAAEAARKQAEGLSARLALLSSKLSELEDERRAELAPDLRAARDDGALLRSQLAGEAAKAAAARQEVADIAAKLEALLGEIDSLRAALEETKEEAGSAELQPGRARQQADAAVAALRALREEEAEVAAQLREQEAAEAAAAQEVKEVSQQHAAAAKAGDKLRSQVAQRERTADEVGRDIEMAKVEAERLLAEQVTWDLEVEKKKGEARAAAEAVKGEQRGREACQRRLNRAELEGGQLAEQLPGLRNAAANMAAALGAEQRAAAREAAAAAAAQAEVARLVAEVAAEKRLTDVQAELVQASLAGVRQLEGEAAALKEAAAERDKAIRAALAQRDAGSHFLHQRTQRLAEVIDEAEARDGEVEELRRKRSEVRSAHQELRELSGLMSSQMGRFQTLLGYAARSAQDLGDRAQAAEGELAQLQAAAAGRASEVRAAERAAARAQADKAALAGQVAGARRRAAAVAEAADTAGVERGLAARGAEEACEAVRRLQARREAGLAAKAAAQRVLLERNEELCGLYEQQDALQQELNEGTAALQRCDDDMRLLQLEVAELQRRLHAGHRAAPDVVAYDRQVAALKADVLRARREADVFGAALESPQDCLQRWRVLPGKMPAKEDLAARIAQIEERLGARKDQAARKDATLEELEALIDSLVGAARAAHGPALDLGLRVAEARRAQAGLARRMMAAVSELSMYQALSLKYAADRDALTSALSAAKQNVAAGRPPTAGADREFERQERDRAAQAEVRAQAAELRQLKAAGLLGALRSTAPQGPVAYSVPGEGGDPEYKPFPAAFKPLRPREQPPAAVAVAAQRAAARGPAEEGLAPRGGPVPLLAAAAVP